MIARRDTLAETGQENGRRKERESHLGRNGGRRRRELARVVDLLLLRITISVSIVLIILVGVVFLLLLLFRNSRRENVIDWTALETETKLR